MTIADTMIVTLKKGIFWIAILFIVLTFCSLTIGQNLPYEFADETIKNRFYDLIMQGFPLAIILTLLGTIKQRNAKFNNWIIGIGTVLASIFSIVVVGNMVFSIGFLSWTTERILYRHKSDCREIQLQIADLGTFGYGGRRIVELKPFLKFWTLPTTMDTATISKQYWTEVN